MQEKMKAVQIHAPAQFSVDWVDIPRPGRNEVLVEIKSVAICGSDPGIFGGKVLQNGWPPYFPFIAGHEFAGRVAALGEGVVKLKEGDRVSGEAHCGCGTCEMCADGHYNLCLNYGQPGSGHHHYGHNTPGCYAQYQVYDQKALTILPENVSYDEGTLVDTAGTAYNALRLTGVEPGGYTAIIGPGPMGMMAMLIAKALGSRTIMIGRGQRLTMAKRWAQTMPSITSRAATLSPPCGNLREGTARTRSSRRPATRRRIISPCRWRAGRACGVDQHPAKRRAEAALKSLIMNQITLHGVRANPNCSSLCCS